MSTHTVTFGSATAHAIRHDSDGVPVAPYRTYCGREFARGLVAEAPTTCRGCRKALDRAARDAAVLHAHRAFMATLLPGTLVEVTSRNKTVAGRYRVGDVGAWTVALLSAGGAQTVAKRVSLHAGWAVYRNHGTQGSQGCDLVVVPETEHRDVDAIRADIERCEAKDRDAFGHLAYGQWSRRARYHRAEFAAAERALGVKENPE